MRRGCSGLALLLVLQMAAGFAASSEAQDAASRAAHHATRLLDAPYRYGGAHPSVGFDCSGLVEYSYRRAGLAVPRTAEEQRRASVRIRLSELRLGDLVFFDQEGRKNSHVGIYIGQGRFIHAPSSGKRVRTDVLRSVYWRKHISEARRLDI